MVLPPLLQAAVGLAGSLFSLGPPRITLLNTGLRIDYAWPQGAGLLAAAVGAALLAAVAPRRWLRAAFGLLAAVVLLASLDRLSYQLEADDGGVASRGLVWTTTIPWREVSRVESGPDVVVIWGTGDAQIRVSTGGFRPEQRAAFDRVVARRVRGGPGDVIR